MRIKKFPMFTKLLVEWEDTTSDSKWHDKESLQKVSVTDIKTLDFFVGNKKSIHGRLMIKLSHSITSDGDADYTAIPYGCIVRIKEVK